MPWKECKPMDERLKFIARLLEGEKMAPVCREFGISRVTGYKIFNRYKDCGLDGLNDRARRPYRQANKLPFQVERTLLGIKPGNLANSSIRGSLILLSAVQCLRPRAGGTNSCGNGKCSPSAPASRAIAHTGRDTSDSAKRRWATEDTIISTHRSARRLKMRTDCVFPRISTSPSGSMGYSPFNKAAVDSEMRTNVPCCLFNCSSRAARFTASPWTV